MESFRVYVRLLVMVICATTVSWPQVVMGMEGIVINEIQVQGQSQYVELYDNGVGSTLLDGLVLALYSGASEVVYSQPLVLDGVQTGVTGYCFISFGPPLAGADVHSSTVLLSSGLNAIALYDQSVGSNIQAGSAVTDVGLVDAVVYGNSSSPQDSALVSVLGQGQYPLQAGNPGSSSGRCRGWKKVMHSSFRTGNLTPGSDNDCVLPSFVINELNPTYIEVLDQFVEIFDGGLGFQSTDGVVLAVYNGKLVQDSVVVAVDLTGYMTDERGFLTVATNGSNIGHVTVPRRGRLGRLLPVTKATGVALHLAPLERFPFGKGVTDYNLIDAIVYQHEDVGIVDHALLYVLTPGQDTLVDPVSTDDQDYSIGRCYCCSPRNSSAFGKTPLSPGAINRDCNIANRTVLEIPPAVARINEVHIGAPGSNDADFVEIYDEGFGQTALAGKVLVVFAATEDGGRSYRIVDLLRSVTNSEGYLVIAPSSVSSASNFDDLGVDWLKGGLDTQQPAGAVAMYERPAAGFTLGSGPVTDGLLDVVVFGNKSSSLTTGLLNSLLLGQTLPISFLPDTASSILRCYSLHPLQQASFAAGSPSPAAPNTCPPPPCHINEMNSLLSSSTGIFMEVACAGIPDFPLDYVIWVLWFPGRLTKAKPMSNSKTNKDGFASSNVGQVSKQPGSFAAALYFTPHATDLSDENNQIRVTNTGLLNAVVVEKGDLQENLTAYINVLTPGEPPVREHEAFSYRDESLSRCLVDGTWTFVLAHVSRNSRNHCPTRDNPDILINEIHLPVRQQFIELFDLGSGFTLLNDFIVVLYSAAGNVLQVISLEGYTTDAKGYFVLGVQDAYFIGGGYYGFAEGLIDPTVGGVALYRSEGGSLTLSVGDMVTTQGLVDAAIYTDDAGNLGSALYTLMADGTTEGLDSAEQHFSRCFSADYRSSSTFIGDRPPTVAAMNDCPVYPSTDVVINELNFGEPGETEPEAFVELYDGGRGNTPLTYITLVAFAAIDNNGAYQTVDLSGYRTNEQGYFLVGSHEAADLVVTLERTHGNKVLIHGAGALALYRSHPGVFHHSAPATKTSLLDAVVYTLDVEEETTLVEDLLPSGSFIIFEDESLDQEDGTDESISRCWNTNRLSQSAFGLTPPTPNGPNSCPDEEPEPTVGLLISEVNVKSASGLGFVELFDGGRGNVSLDGYLLVFFQGARDRSFYEIDLTGKRTGFSGYLVIGGPDVTPTPDVIVAGLSFSSQPGAVAVYQGSIDSFPRGTVATPRSLVDVVVFGDPQARVDGLIAKLVPGQIQAYENEMSVSGQDVSLSRCISQSARKVAAFVSTLKTPGSPNNCDALYKPVYFNEISPYGAPSQRFVELYDGGHGYTSLDAIVLLLLVEDGPYSVIPLTGNRTNSDGYYLVANVTELRPMGRVALYRGDYSVFSLGRAPTGSMVAQQPYSSHDVDTSLIQGSSTALKKTFSRCDSCQSSPNQYFTLAPATPGSKNRCPASDYGTQVAVTLTDASFDDWKSNEGLVSVLEDVLAKGINSQCRCGFTAEYFCDTKLLEGSVVYQAVMYATDSEQTQLLKQSFQAFMSDTRKITVNGKAYTVAETETETGIGSGPSASVVVPVILAAVVLIGLSIAAGYLLMKRKSAQQQDDNVKLEERNDN